MEKTHTQKDRHKGVMLTLAVIAVLAVLVGAAAAAGYGEVDFAAAGSGKKLPGRLYLGSTPYGEQDQMNQGLYLITPGDGKKRLISPRSIDGVAISPDGTKLAAGMLAETGGDPQLAVFDATDPAFKLLRGVFEVREGSGPDQLTGPTWAKDSNTLVVSRVGDLHIYDYAKDKGSRKIIGGWQAALSPVDNRLVVAGDGLSVLDDALKGAYTYDPWTEEMYVFETPREGALTPIPGAPSDATKPEWSPDGASVVFVSKGTVWVIPAAGGSPKALTPDGWKATAPVYSPDGSYVAFVRLEAEPEGGIWAVRADGTEPKQILRTAMDHIWGTDLDWWASPGESGSEEPEGPAEQPECLKDLLKKDFMKKDKKEGQKCQQLYKFNKKAGTCIFAGTQGVPLDSDSRDGIESLIETMKPTNGSVYEGKFRDGRSFKVGIVRGADGAFEFTSDGLNYHNNLEAALKPGLFTKIGGYWKKIKTGFGFGLFDKYVGKDTAGDKEAQEDGQRRYDAASQALKTLQKVRSDPAKQEEIGKEVIDRGMGGMTNLLEGKYGDVVLDELKALTGCDLPLLKKILSGEFVDALLDVEMLKRQVYLFPAQSVIILAKELRTANYAEAVSLYIQERPDKSPETIRILLQGGQLPELDVYTSIKGVAQHYSPHIVLASYEEAYQRYLIAQEMSSGGAAR